VAAILFEHPFDELTSNYLRVETLFSRVDVLINRFFPIDHHFCLLSLFEVAELDDQFDLSTLVLQELDSQVASLNAYKGNPHVSETALNELLLQVEQHRLALRSQKKRLAHFITDDEWLYKLRERMGLPGGTSSFEAARYFAWQHRSGEDRREDLLGWLDWFSALRESTAFLLELLRSSVVRKRLVAKGGEFRQSIPQGKCKLVQVWVDPKLKVTPEVHGNKLMVSIRFLDRGPRGQTSACLDDIPFEIGLALER
jgi:cell division protein ZapD